MVRTAQLAGPGPGPGLAFPGGHIDGLRPSTLLFYVKGYFGPFGQVFLGEPAQLGEVHKHITLVRLVVDKAIALITKKPLQDPGVCHGLAAASPRFLASKPQAFGHAQMQE